MTITKSVEFIGYARKWLNENKTYGTTRKLGTEQWNGHSQTMATRKLKAGEKTGEQANRWKELNRYDFDR